MNPYAKTEEPMEAAPGEKWINKWDGKLPLYTGGEDISLLLGTE